MEVLNGNQTDTHPARRRGDRNANAQRALSWVKRDSDIALLPHSPLAIADVLCDPNGCFDLVADDADARSNSNLAESAPMQTNASTSLQHRRQRKNPRGRANLLTQLSQQELIHRCKQIQIENALVTKAGVKRLYLTAGFLTWSKGGTDESETYRAPVLFYPATLVRKANDADRSVETLSANTAASQNEDGTEHIEYEIRLTGELPDTNKALLHWCEKEWQLELPEYSQNLPLQDYFAQLAQVISGDSPMELEFDIALGNSAPPIPSVTDIIAQLKLPALPEHFDTSLAMAIAGNKNLQQLHSVLNLLKDYGDNKTDELPIAANEAAGAVSSLHEYSKKLSSAGLAGVEFQHLPSLPENISSWVENINKALQSDMITNVLNMPNISARHLIRLAGVIELIDKAPLNIEQFKHADLCYSATPSLLQRAHHQSRLIEDELSTLQNTFVLDKVPAKKQLLSLIGELGGSLDEGPDIIDADYFNARRQFMEFSIEKPTNLTPEHRSLLGKLAKVLRFRELFVNNIEYRLALGPGYRGLRTDWDAMKATVDYAQEFSEVLESESIAACAMGQWTEFRSAYITELEILQNAAESLRKLLWICGSDWQTRPVDEVIEQSSQTRMMLLAWAEIYGSFAQGSNKTPASVLAQFSGKSQEDVLTEIHVGETQATIDEHMNDGGTTPDAVIETIEWLRQASQTASDLHLEITAIVDHLRIA